MKKSEIAVVGWLTALLSIASLNLLAGKTGCSGASFEPARKTNLGVEGIWGIRSGDFNGDGKLDLVAKDYSNVYLLLGRGDGYFEPPNLITPGFGSALILAAADFSGDNRSDLILLDPNPVLLLGRSDGGFDRNSVQVDIGALGVGNIVTGSIVEVDFNEDGKADLAGELRFGSRGNVVVTLNNRDGTFGPVTEYEIGMPVSRVYVKAGDVDGDRDLDLIRISEASIGTVGSGPGIRTVYTNTVSVLMNNGDGTFQPGPSRHAGIDIMYSAAVADFNGDCKADLACSHHIDIAIRAQDTVAVLLGNGDGTFGPPALWDTGYEVAFIFTGDFNGDGAVDLGTRFSAGGVRLLLGNGDGTFQLPGSYIAIAPNPWMERSSQIVGDFNGDGQVDFATETGTGVQVILNACRPPPDPPNGLWIQRRNQTAVLSWPLIPGGFLLESTTNAGLAEWSIVTGNFATNQNRFELETPIEGAQRYFRLREPP